MRVDSPALPHSLFRAHLDPLGCGGRHDALREVSDGIRGDFGTSRSLPFPQKRELSTLYFNDLTESASIRIPVSGVSPRRPSLRAPLFRAFRCVSCFLSRTDGELHGVQLDQPSAHPSTVSGDSAERRDLQAAGDVFCAEQLSLRAVRSDVLSARPTHAPAGHGAVHLFPAGAGEFAATAVGGGDGAGGGGGAGNDDVHARHSPAGKPRAHLRQHHRGAGDARDGGG